MIFKISWKKVNIFTCLVLSELFLRVFFSIYGGKPGFCASKNVPKYNRPAIDDAITSGKQLRFSHDPRKYHDCVLEWEWNYIKDKMNIDEFDVDDVLIYREDGFWYVEK